MKYLTFVIIALTARVYIVASECWLPIICNGIPYWTKIETACHQNSQVAEMKKLIKNDLDELTDQTTDMSNQLKDLEKKLEKLESRKAANNPPQTTSEDETTTYSIGTSVLLSETTSVQETLEQATQTAVQNIKTTSVLETLEQATLTTDKSKEITGEDETTTDSIDTAVLISETASVQETLEQATQTTDRSIGTTPVQKSLDQATQTTERSVETTSVQETPEQITQTAARSIKTTSVQGNLEQATQTTVRNMEATGISPCTYTYNSTLCYWVEATDLWDTNYGDAVKICENQRSEISQIYNKEIYEEVGKIVRPRIPKGASGISVWIGLMIDTKTGEPTYPSTNAFTLWHPIEPEKKDGRTNVVIHVHSDENYTIHGMWNLDPSWTRSGVVCQVRTG